MPTRSMHFGVRARAMRMLDRTWIVRLRENTNKARKTVVPACSLENEFISLYHMIYVQRYGTDEYDIQR